MVKGVWICELASKFQKLNVRLRVFMSTQFLILGKLFPVHFMKMCENYLKNEVFFFNSTEAYFIIQNVVRSVL